MDADVQAELVGVGLEQGGGEARGLTISAVVAQVGHHVGEGGELGDLLGFFVEAGANELQEVPIRDLLPCRKASLSLHCLPVHYM